jgi:hypothetical protein
MAAKKIKPVVKKKEEVPEKVEVAPKKEVPRKKINLDKDPHHPSAHENGSTCVRCDPNMAQ